MAVSAKFGCDVPSVFAARLPSALEAAWRELGVTDERLRPPPSGGFAVAFGVGPIFAYQQAQAHGDWPTPREILAAAHSIRKDAERLIAKLKGDMGGARPLLHERILHQDAARILEGPSWIFSGVDPPLAETLQAWQILEELPMLLARLAAACREAEEATITPQKTKPPRLAAARSLAANFRAIGIEPTRYCSDVDPESRGPFAILLAAYLHYLEGEEPSAPVLHKLVIDALK